MLPCLTAALAFAGGAALLGQAPPPGCDVDERRGDEYRCHSKEDCQGARTCSKYEWCQGDSGCCDKYKNNDPGSMCNDPSCQSCRVAPPQVKLVLTRHGQSQGNKGLCGKGNIKDPMLTQVGIEQAEHARDYLKEHNIVPDLIFASTLMRAQETSLIVYGCPNQQTVFVAPNSTPRSGLAFSQNVVAKVS